MAFVFKIKYEDSLRRVTVPKTTSGAPELTFTQLDAKIREYFDIPASAKLVITYTDKDNDTITMTEDQELHDACVLQGINPLRLDVAVEGQAPDLKSSMRRMRDIKSIFDAESLKEAIEPILKMGGLGMSQKVVSEFIQALSKPSAEDRSETSAQPTGKAPERAEPDSTAFHTPPSTTRSEGNRAGLDGVFHHNVQCDGCGISPIVGPRFKSLSKLDYDLCLSCFNDLSKGSEQDYVRYDQPVQRYHHSAGAGFGRVGRCPAFAQGRRPWGSGRAGDHGVYRLDTFFPRPFGFRGNDSSYDHCAGTWASKPDGRFVCDVTIPDGAAVSPSTPFVKIWRLRNSGKAAWTANTKLVRVGGDEMGPVSAVTLQVPPSGLAPEAEVDVAVDLIAPPRPGRYVSYWRLMTPYGVKFGHRVWALIQVTPNAPAFTTQRASDVNNEKVEKDAEDIDNVGNPEAVEVVEVEDGGVEVLSVTAEVAEEPVAADASDSGKSDAEEDLKTEVEGFSLVEMPKKEEDAAKPEPEVKKEEAKPVDDKRRNEAAGLLESMGFLNKLLVLELLAKNDNDLQRTLDDLVAAAEWDPILEELEEMGFYDVEMNRRLMIKNNGSVKRVVKELVEMYKEPSLKSLD